MDYECHGENEVLFRGGKRGRWAGVEYLQSVLGVVPAVVKPAELAVLDVGLLRLLSLGPRDDSVEDRPMVWGIGDVDEWAERLPDVVHTRSPVLGGDG